MLEQEAVAEGAFPRGSVTVRVLRLRHHIRVKVGHQSRSSIRNRRGCTLPPNSTPPTPQVLNCRHLRPLGSERRSLKRSKSGAGGPGQGAMEILKEKYSALRQGVAGAREEAHRAASHGMCSPYVTVKLVPGDQVRQGAVRR